MKTFEDVKMVMAALLESDIFDLTRFMVEDSEIIAGVECSDVFWWGCVDHELIEAEDAPLLLKCKEDITNLGVLEEHLIRYHTATLYCARKREMRPQGAMYKNTPVELWPLFNACGPHRPSELGNPYATPEKPEDLLKENN